MPPIDDPHDDTKIHTYRPPEQFERWVDEDKRPPGIFEWDNFPWWIFIGGGTVWVIVAWVLVARYW